MKKSQKYFQDLKKAQSAGKPRMLLPDEEVKGVTDDMVRIGKKSKKSKLYAGINDEINENIAKEREKRGLPPVKKDEKGVHNPKTPKSGESEAGAKLRTHNRKLKENQHHKRLHGEEHPHLRFEANTWKGSAKEKHKRVLDDLKRTPKPDLPKSEMEVEAKEKGLTKAEYFGRLKKAVKSPSKHVSKQFIKDTLKDNNIAASGKEYQEDEMKDLLTQKESQDADKWADEQWDNWIESQVKKAQIDLSKKDILSETKKKKESNIKTAKQMSPEDKAELRATYVKAKDALKDNKEHNAILDEKIKQLDLSKEELEKSKNVREQKAKVWGTNPMPAKGSAMREKMVDKMIDWAKKRYGVDVVVAPGKPNASGKIINKPEMSDTELQHLNNPASLAHELAHLEIMKQKGMGLSDFQDWADKRWGQINKDYGYKSQAQEQEEYASHGAENKMRRYFGIPAHPRETKEMGEKRLYAVDNPKKQIAMDIPHKNKRTGEMQTKRITGLSSNLEPRQREFEERQMGVQEFSPKTGWKDSDKPDALINRRAMGDKQGAMDLLRQKFGKKNIAQDHPHAQKLARIDKLIGRLQSKRSDLTKKSELGKSEKN